MAKLVMLAVHIANSFSLGKIKKTNNSTVLKVINFTMSLFAVMKDCRIESFISRVLVRMVMVSSVVLASSMA
jgi:hypothetical protein